MNDTVYKAETCIIRPAGYMGWLYGMVGYNVDTNKRLHDRSHFTSSYHHHHFIFKYRIEDSMA